MFFLLDFAIFFQAISWSRLENALFFPAANIFLLVRTQKTPARGAVSVFPPIRVGISASFLSGELLLRTSNAGLFRTFSLPSADVWFFGLDGSSRDLGYPVCSFCGAPSPGLIE